MNNVPSVSGGYSLISDFDSLGDTPGTGRGSIVFPKTGKDGVAPGDFGGESCRGGAFFRPGLGPAGARQQVTQLRDLPGPPANPPTGGAPGGRSRTGLSAPRRLMPRCASAAQAVDAPLRLKTARRSLKGEVFPRLGAAAPPAGREAAGAGGHRGWSQSGPRRPPRPSAGRPICLRRGCSSCHA